MVITMAKSKTVKVEEVKEVATKAIKNGNLNVSNVQLEPFVPDFNNGAERYSQPLNSVIKFNNQFILEVAMYLEHSDKGTTISYELVAYDPMTNTKVTGSGSLE